MNVPKNFLKYFLAFSLVLTSLLSFAVQVEAVSNAPPVLFFSDLESGPNTGGQDNKGVFVTVWGKNFGSSQGSSYVTIGGGQADNYPVWSDTEITFQLGPNAATGNITVTTTAGTSNGLPFTVRSGNIYFVDVNSPNDPGTGTYSDPWRSPSSFYSNKAPGDICYIRAGTYSGQYGHQGWEANLCFRTADSGTSDNPIAWVGYPNEVATFVAKEKTIYIGVRCKDNELPSHIVIAGLYFDSDHGCISIENGFRVVGNDCIGISKLSATGIIARGGTNVAVLGNTCHGGSSGSKLDHAIYINHGTNVEVAWNHIYNNNFSDGEMIVCNHDNAYNEGTVFSNIRIHDNFIDTSIYGSRAIGIYETGAGSSFKIYNNILKRPGGIQPWDYDIACISGQLEIYNNIIYDSVGAAAFGFYTVYESGHQYFPESVKVHNNIVWVHDTNTDYWYYSSDGGMPTPVVSNNCWYNKGDGPEIDTDPVNANPLFVNPGTDFHLQSGSPCIDAGYDTSSVVQRDYDGNLRPQGAGYDIGAYEYVTTGLNITTTSLPYGIVNSPYSQTLQASGGTTPYTWSISSGSLPDGVSLNSSTGTISGTPTTEGTFNFTVKVTDLASPANTDTQDLSITINYPDTTPPTISSVVATPSSNSATITWQTDELATSRIDYGLTPSYGSYEEDLTLKQSHSITLTTLEPETTYYYKITSNDSSGNSATYSDQFTTTSILPPDLVLLLHFDEGSGGVAYDSSTYGNDGTIHGASWAYGKLGSALLFNGTDNYVEIPHSDSLNLDKEISMVAWVKPSQAADGNIRYSIYKDDMWGIAKNASGYLYGFTNIAGTERFVISEFILQDDKWNHVAYTFDGSVMRIYADGELQAEAAYSGSILTSGNPVRIGMHDSKWYWDGSIDEVKIWNRALSADEILDHYNQEFDSDADGLPDSWERTYWGDLTHTATEDYDNDGLTNLEEHQNNTDPTDSDTDNDSMPDGWEVTYNLYPLVNDSALDSDEDGFANLEEYTAGTNPDDINDHPTIRISDTFGCTSSSDNVAHVEVADAAGIARIDITLTYDTSVLVYDPYNPTVPTPKVQVTELTQGFNLTYDAYGVGQISISMQGETAIPEGSGSIVDILFNVEDVESGATSPLLFLSVQLQDTNGNPLPSIKDDGTFRVAGDVKVDGVINAGDAILARRIASKDIKEPTAKQIEDADVNGDGKVTDDDAILILQKSAGTL